MDAHSTLNLSMGAGAVIGFVGYLLIVMLVGVVAYRLTRNLSDYVLGGRSLGGAVAALSAGASDMSSWLLMGLPGLVYLSGPKNVWVAIGLTLGAYGSWKLVAKRLRIYSEVANDSVTVPAYLDNRFRDTSRMIRTVAAVATLIFFMFYIAAGLYAGGVLLGLMFKVEYTVALWMGAVIIMLYTSIGGFLAVSWTDFFQGTLMLFCLVIVPFFAMENYGGWSIGIQKLLSIQPTYFDLMKGMTISKFISLFSWGLGYFGMPHILVRFMAVKTVKEIPLARTVCMWWMSLSLIGAILVGLAGAIHFCNYPLDNHETVFMVLSEKVFVSWMMGIILAAILSSSMCAVDSQMLAASSALTEDVYRAMFRRNASQRELVWVGRVTVAVIALVAIYIARKPSQSIMDLVSFAWAGLGATFAAPIVLSLFWKRTTRNGIVVGMVGGCCTVILWHYSNLSNLMYEILPGVLVSLTSVVVTSLLDNPPQAIISEEFEKVEELCRMDATVIQVTSR
jgi:sodium/proline symporter